MVADSKERRGAAAAGSDVQTERQRNELDTMKQRPLATLAVSSGKICMTVHGNGARNVGTFAYTLPNFFLWQCLKRSPDPHQHA
jgi:hypothetical protein